MKCEAEGVSCERSWIESKCLPIAFGVGSMFLANRGCLRFLNTFVSMGVVNALEIYGRRAQEAGQASFPAHLLVRDEGFSS